LTTKFGCRNGRKGVGFCHSRSFFGIFRWDVRQFKRFSVDFSFSFWNRFRYCFLFVYILLLQCAHFIWYNGGTRKSDPRETESRRFTESRGGRELILPSRLKGRNIMTKSNCILTCEIDMNEYARLFSFAPLSENTCAVTAYNGSETASLLVPATDPDGRTVVAIGDRAFMNCTFLRAVTLPDTIESVGVRAFAFCTNLLDIRFGSECRLASIGNRAFMGCERLTVLRFGRLAHLSNMGRSTFAYCTRLRSVVLPEGMTELAPSLFEGCTALEHIRLPESLTVISTAAFSACGALRVLTLPASVKVIEDCAFAWCGHLTDLRLPESPCVISGSAFMECYALEDVLKVG
jgi:hypothetical protein